VTLNKPDSFHELIVVEELINSVGSTSIFNGISGGNVIGKYNNYYFK
jgi:hypothetical protein